MKRVGLIGWRGMVGSVLMGRMRDEGDFNDIEPVFFTTSQVGQAGPDIGKEVEPLKDATDIGALKAMDVIITCQGGDFTREIYPTRPRRCAWMMMRLLSWIQSISTSSRTGWPMVSKPGSAAIVRSV